MKFSPLYADQDEPWWEGVGCVLDFGFKIKLLKFTCGYCVNNTHHQRNHRQ